MSNYSNKIGFWCLFNLETFEPAQIYLSERELEQELIRLYGKLNVSLSDYYYEPNSVDFQVWRTIPGSELIDWVESLIEVK